MIDLTVIILLIVVVFILAAVAYFGLRGNRRSHEASRSSSATAEAPKEPVFRREAEPSAVPPPQPAELPIDFTPLPILPSPDKSLLAEDICYVINAYGDEMLTVVAFQPLVEKLANYRVSVYRILGYDETEKQWKQSITDSFRYWLIALPLADRGGKLEESKIKLIEETVRQFAERLQLRLGFPPLSITLENARLLDNFCSAVDMVLECRLNCSKAHSLKRINDVMLMHKMIASDDNRYIYRLDSEILFTAQCSSTNSMVQSIILSLDAPRVSLPERALDNMERCIKRIATVLDATITDPRGEVIDDARMIEIRRQLSILKKQMGDYGVPPGSAVAHLLFS